MALGLGRLAPFLAALVAGVLVLLAGQVQAGRLRDDVRRAEVARCPVLLRQAGLPAAPGAPRDRGTLALAAAAAAEYQQIDCPAAGYGPTPPVVTGR